MASRVTVLLADGAQCVGEMHHSGRIGRKVRVEGPYTVDHADAAK
jgi:hypothetical protein